jgi:hypothetical protein
MSVIGITRSPLKSHRFSDPRNSVEVIIHNICMIFGYDRLCDLLEMLNLINIGSAVATRRNLVDPIQ